MIPQSHPNTFIYQWGNDGGLKHPTMEPSRAQPLPLTTINVTGYSKGGVSEKEWLSHLLQEGTMDHCIKSSWGIQQGEVRYTPFIPVLPRVSNKSYHTVSHPAWILAEKSPDIIHFIQDSLWLQTNYLVNTISKNKNKKNGVLLITFQNRHRASWGGGTPLLLQGGIWQLFIQDSSCHHIHQLGNLIRQRT